MTYRTFTTRSRNRPLLPAAALPVALLAGCTASSGPPVTEQRTVATFHEIELRGATDASVEVGPPTSLAIIADRATLPGVTTEVRDGKLIVEHRTHWFWMHSAHVQLRIATPTLEAFSVSGAGNATVNGVHGDKLELELDGAGNLAATGTVGKLDAEINGAGNMNLADLAARDATVSVNGAGNLRTQVSGALDAQLNGVGNIVYSGNPQQVKSEVNGVGSIKAAGG